VASTRRHDLDALRVLAVLVLLAYHASRPFDLEPWHAKSEWASAWVQLVGGVFTPWRLPLLFMVSGAGTYFALRRRSAGAYARERLIRLGIPLVVGMLVVVPPQVYVERISPWMPNRQSPIDFEGSYLAFQPRIVDGAYPAGNLSWHHLWFLAYLLVFSLAALPLLRWLDASGRRVREALGATLARPGAVFLPVVPLAVVHVGLRGAFPSTHALIGDWWNLAHYFVVFVLGSLLVTDPAFMAAAVRHRHLAAATFGALTVVRLGLILAWPPALPYSRGYVLQLVVRAALEWSALVAVLGHARRWLDRPSPLLRWAGDRVYPFYVWHQTVLVVLAYWVLRWPAGPGVQYVALLLGGFALSLLLCQLVASTRVTRLAFGMRP
jgi:peptidoglycan/LPS O-acetylase OafA/YrhL